MTIYDLLAKICTPRRMVHYKSFPSGTQHVSIHCFDKDQTFLYDHPTTDGMLNALLKDWDHLLMLRPKPIPTPRMPKP